MIKKNDQQALSQRLHSAGGCRAVICLEGPPDFNTLLLVEEVLMGLDEVKRSLEQAVTVLEDMTEDLRPDVGDNLKEVLETTLLHPLQSRMMVLETLLDELAATV